MIGHDNDVQDLGWSNDSSILVSVGLDSKVVVWSARTFEKLKTLSHHQSLVKGITFDPANKYFATASDDRTIRVFRFTSPAANASAQDQANNFALESTITAPFAGSPLTTYFRRCSWSPEGNHIAAANAVNGPVSSVAIITRGTWESEIHLIGHEGPVEVCAFSPRMFHENPPAQTNGAVQNGSGPPSVNVLACAGQDKTLSIWNTKNSKAYVITQELTEKSISDLSWSPDGEKVFAVSLDGSIMAFVFEPGELGWPASLQENEKSLSRYGAGRKAGVSESADAIILEDLSRDDEVRGVQGRMGELMGDKHGVGSDTVVKAGVDEKAACHDSATTDKVAEHITGNGKAQAQEQNASGQYVARDTRIDKLKQRVTITKEGKKRIAPLLVSSSSGMTQSALPQSQLLAITSQSVRSDAPQTVLDLSQPYDGLPKGGLASLLIGNRYKITESDDNVDKANDKQGQQTLSAKSIQLNGNSHENMTNANNRSYVPDVLRPAMLNPSISLSQVRLAVPMVRSQILRTSDASNPKDARSKDTDNDIDMSTTKIRTTILEARNDIGQSRLARTHGTEPVRITCSSQGHSIWQDYLPRSVLLLTGNSKFWAAGSEDGTIYTWTPMGRRLLNPILLEAQPAILDCRGTLLLCITAVGLCYVWNVQQNMSLHPPVSIAPILDSASQLQVPHLSSAPSLIFARLNSAGHIIVGLSNGDGFAYSSALTCWQRLSEPWWAVGSQYWNTTDSSVGNVQNSQNKNIDPINEVTSENLSAGIIPLLERHTSSYALLKGRAYLLQRLVKVLLSAEGYEGFESSVSIAHLENRVSAALMLGAREEFRIYLLMYMKRIGAEGLKNKIEELLRNIAGEIFSKELSQRNKDLKSGDYWENGKETICGFTRKELLREVILVLGMLFDCFQSFSLHQPLISFQENIEISNGLLCRMPSCLAYSKIANIGHSRCGR